MKHDLQFDDFVSEAFADKDAGYVELPISQRVFLFVLILAGLTSFVVLGRVAFLNMTKKSFYAARAQSNANQEVSLPAHRGLITDRYGEVLAKNAETFSVFISTANLLKDRRHLEEVIDKLSQALELTPDEVRTIIQTNDFEKKSTIAVARNVSPETAIAIKGLAIPEVEVRNDYRREYVDGPTFSQVIGYTGVSKTSNDIVGKSGLESYYDASLRGTDGAKAVYKDAKGKQIDERIVSEPEAGQMLKTTIDAKLQEYFHERLSQGIRNLGVSGGVGIAMQPKTGQVLALISEPSYDNNLFVTPGAGSELTSLFTDKKKPLFNRALLGAYNPGSTIKPLVALAALKEGVVTPDFQIYSKGYIEIANPFFPDKPSRFVDWRPQGWVDVHSALARSSNVYFYEVGGGFPGSPGEPAVKGLGIEKLKQYWQYFGLGQKTNIDADSENTGFLPDAAEKEKRTGQPWRIGDTYNVSIGQGDLLVSPIQLINFISSIANGGKLFVPKLALEMSMGGKVTKDLKEPQLLLDYGTTFKSELADIRQGMRDGASKSYGTSYKLADLPMPVAAKTGSAQIQNNTKTNAFFVGYAPADDPQIAILVLVEDAKEGSLNAVPIAKDILQWYYDNRINMSPTE